MKEDNHYNRYHSIIERGYDSEFENSNENIEDRHNFLYPNVHNDRYSKYFSYDQKFEADHFFVEDSTSQNLQFRYKFPNFKEPNEGSHYIQEFSKYSAEVQNEKSANTLFSTPLTATTTVQENVQEISCLTNIFSAITNFLHKSKVLLQYGFNDAQKTTLDIIIDMLTLVIFIVLLKRWIQFDVLGHSERKTKTCALDKDITHRQSRNHHKKKQHSKLEFDSGLNKSLEFINAPHLSSSNQSSSSQNIKDEFRSASVSELSIFDDDSSFDSDSIEISISDEISSIFTSSLSSNDTFDETDNEELEINEYNTNCNTIRNSNLCSIKESDLFLPTQKELHQLPRRRTDSSHSGQGHFSENCNDNEELEVISSSINSEDDQSSECSWFNEYYPKEKRNLIVTKHKLLADCNSRFLVCILNSLNSYCLTFLNCILFIILGQMLEVSTVTQQM